MEFLEKTLVVLTFYWFAKGRGGWWVLMGKNFWGQIVVDWVFGDYVYWLDESFHELYLIFQRLVLSLKLGISQLQLWSFLPQVFNLLL